MLALVQSARNPCLPLLALLSLAACGEDPSEVTASGGPGDAAVAAIKCTENATQACGCPNEPESKQYCYMGHWTACGCSAPVTPVVTNTAGSCKAGRYEGNFGGLYFSGFSPGGIPVPVVGVDLSLIPPLVITLSESGNCSGLSEFCTYSVSDGYVKGTADGIFPFEGKITGSLDCSTKLFQGTFEGYYSLLFNVGVDLNKGYFKGPVTAVYDAATSSFKQGTWNVKEYMGGLGGFGFMLAEFGGGGDWHAEYKNASTVVMVPDAGLPSQPDAAVHDAGP